MFFMTVKHAGRSPDPFERGYFVGILVGEGSFGGDGRQPQITVRMHTRHEALFRWLEAHFPRCRLYGPYHHGGRSYYQWMARGDALVADVLPVLEAELDASLDGHAAERFQAMLRDYASFIEGARRRARLLADGEAGE
jgi:hypothetical protein